MADPERFMCLVCRELLMRPLLIPCQCNAGAGRHYCGECFNVDTMNNCAVCHQRVSTRNIGLDKPFWALIRRSYPEAVAAVQAGGDSGLFDAPLTNAQKGLVASTDGELKSMLDAMAHSESQTRLMSDNDLASEILARELQAEEEAAARAGPVKAPVNAAAAALKALPPVSVSLSDSDSDDDSVVFLGEVESTDPAELSLRRVLALSAQEFQAARQQAAAEEAARTKGTTAAPATPLPAKPKLVGTEAAAATGNGKMVVKSSAPAAAPATLPKVAAPPPKESQCRKRKRHSIHTFWPADPGQERGHALNENAGLPMSQYAAQVRDMFAVSTSSITARRRVTRPAQDIDFDDVDAEPAQRSARRPAGLHTFLSESPLKMTIKHRDDL